MVEAAVVVTILVADGYIMLRPKLIHFLPRFLDNANLHGNLTIRYRVEFPQTLIPAQVDAIEQILGRPTRPMPPFTDNSTSAKVDGMDIGGCGPSKPAPASSSSSPSSSSSSSHTRMPRL